MNSYYSVDSVDSVQCQWECPVYCMYSSGILSSCRFQILRAPMFCDVLMYHINVSQYQSITCTVPLYHVTMYLCTVPLCHMYRTVVYRTHVPCTVPMYQPATLYLLALILYLPILFTYCWSPRTLRPSRATAVKAWLIAASCSSSESDSYCRDANSAKTAAEMQHELKAFPAKSASSFSDSVTSEAISSTYRPWNLNISEPKLALPTQIMGPSLWLLKLAIVVELAHTTD